MAIIINVKYILCIELHTYLCIITLNKGAGFTISCSFILIKNFYNANNVHLKVRVRFYFLKYLIRLLSFP